VDNFWIIGGGKFGLKAAQSLTRADASNKITIVEKQKAVCRQLDRLEYEAVCMDGVQYLERNLTGAHFPDWIIPAVPVHVAFEWIRAKLPKTRPLHKIAVPMDVTKDLPNPIQGESGRVFISIADFQCPENCPEPTEICTYTDKPRPLILHEFLKSLQLKDFTSNVIRSHQLAPGVGGYTPAALFDVLNQIRNMQAPALLSTACSCHGVMNAFHLLPAADSIGRG